jgi:DNA invertase Pin-like site-specific DNA recombinase
MARSLRIGYGRVSTTDQRLDVQQAQLDACCDRVYVEQRSGTSLKRPQLQEILRWIGAGDVLVVCKLDRLARSITDLYWIMGQLRERGATLEVLDHPLDLETMGGKITFTILGLCAELETSLRKERQMAGIAAAQARGVHFGRAKQLTPDQVTELCQLKAAGVAVPELVKRYGMTRTSIYRYLAQPQPQTEAAGCAEPGVGYGVDAAAD